MHKLSYQPGTSLVHRLYPVNKLAWLLASSGLLFFLTAGTLLVLTAGIFTAILYWINPDIWHTRGFRFAFITGFMLLILHMLFYKDGQVLIDPGGAELFIITTGGLEMGLRFSSRFIAIISLSYIFILTTEPSDLAYALMKMGLPYRFGFMLVTALRLAPLLEQEGGTIYQAQLVRGVRYDRGQIKKGFLLVQQFMTPLLISALRRADKLVFSMEGRGFGKYSKRTFRNRPAKTRLDILISLLLSIYFATLLFLDYGSV